jgi:putative tricarboxylic transport membrane protein
MSDRIVGVLLFVLAIGYGAATWGFTSAFTSDPLGPTAFPRLLAALLVIASVYLIVRPGPEAEWPRGPALLHQVLAVAVMIGYAFVLEPVGFIPATFAALTVIGAQLGARYLPAAVMGGVGSISLFVLFDLVLGLPLPMGTLFGG